MPFEIIRNDITKMSVDVIVNAANTTLKMGGGVSGAIFASAGENALQAQCDAIDACKVGEAVITGGYKLAAKYIIHTVGPIWQGGNHCETEKLKNCYTNSLILAQKTGCKSIAFPLISSGIYGYPKDKALQIAVSAIGDFLLHNELTVFLVVYDKQSFVLSEKLFSTIEKYIDEHYIDEHPYDKRNRAVEAYEQQKSEVVSYISLSTANIPISKQKGKRSLEDVVARLDETFTQMLLRLIDEKGKTDVEIYKKANIDRKLFSKIRSNKEYKPAKVTAIALAIALELNLDETKDLLAKAGFTLSHSYKFDLIIEFFIKEENYNIFEINEALFYYAQALLGA